MGEQRRAEREMGGSVGVMTTPSERAAALYAAFRGRAPISPFTDDEPDMSVADAYAVQQSYVDLLLEGTGGKVVGYKLGLTSEPMQQMMGVHEPDYGPVLSHMVFDDGSAVDLSSYIQPRVEAEIALVLNRELRGPGITALEAGRAVEGAVAAIEMVDSRIVDWKIKLADTIADLASAAPPSSAPGWCRSTGPAPHRDGHVAQRRDRRHRGRGGRPRQSGLNRWRGWPTPSPPTTSTLEEGMVHHDRFAPRAPST
jgi:hypothetical protein